MASLEVVPFARKFKCLEKQMKEQSSDLYVVGISLQRVRQLADACDFFYRPGILCSICIILQVHLQFQTTRAWHNVHCPPCRNSLENGNRLHYKIVELFTLDMCMGIVESKDLIFM